MNWQPDSLHYDKENGNKLWKSIGSIERTTISWHFDFSSDCRIFSFYWPTIVLNKHTKIPCRVWSMLRYNVYWWFEIKYRYVWNEILILKDCLNASGVCNSTIHEMLLNCAYQLWIFNSFMKKIQKYLIKYRNFLSEMSYYS